MFHFLSENIKMLCRLRRLLDLVYQDVEKILQFPEVTSVVVEYVELD